PFYSDLRIKHVTVKGLSVGDELEYRIVWKVTKPLAPGQFWYAYNFGDSEIFLDEQLQISVPHGRALKVKSPEVKPVVKQIGATDVYTWSHRNLQVKAPDTKADREKLIQVARGRGPGLDVQLSTFQSWDEVGRWYGTLQEDRVKPTPEIQAKAAALIKGAAD